MTSFSRIYGETQSFLVVFHGTNNGSPLCSSYWLKYRIEQRALGESRADRDRAAPG
jgi:hypothetical protein